MSANGMRLMMIWGFTVSTTLLLTLTSCSETSPADPEEPDPSAGGASGSVDPCEQIAADECEAHDRCALATTFDCEAWEEVSYCVSTEVNWKCKESRRGVAQYTGENITEGQCYDFEGPCYTGRFRAPQDAECEVCDF